MKPAEPLHRSIPYVEDRAAQAPPVRGAPAGDAALVERARRGDPEAFRALAERHQDRAYGLALRILRSTADAEEVAQDALVRAWQGLARFRGESSFGTWLHRIVARAALDRAAVLRTRHARELDLDEDAIASDLNPGFPPEARAARSLAVERMVGSLSEPQRAAVTLYYLEDRSVDRVARAMGVPVGTVKTHLSRARAAMRRKWLRAKPGDQP